MCNTCYDRELSGCSERHVRRAISSNVQCLQRMCLQRKLEAHAGCVNTVSFDTEGGDVLISGSDDQQILLWDWQRGTVRLRFDSGHANNVFQARMLPHSSGSRLITCAADGQVRLIELPEGAGSLSVANTLLGEHMGRAHKLALDPLNPGCCFYSSGEDGQVVHYDLRCGQGPSQQQQQQPSGSSSSRRSGSRLKLLLCQGYSKARGPTNRVVGINAIHVNPTRPWQFAVGGSDAWARVYDLRKTRDPPQNPSSSSSSSSGVTSGSGSSLAAAAAAAAACYGRDRYWTRSSSSTDATAAGEQQQQQQIGPPTRAEVRYSRVYGLADEPVARLCPESLWGARASGFGGDPSITCVMFSQQGELLASYNDDDIYMFSSQASCGFLDLNSSSSSSDAAGHVGSNSRGGGGRARQDSAAAAPAAVAGDGSRQQQQQQRSSPCRRSRAEADAVAAVAAAAGDAMNEQQTGGSQPGNQQQQQQDGGSDADEQPRWKRRQQQQQLQTDVDSRSAAAVAATEGSRQHEVGVSGQPLAAAAAAAAVRRTGAVLEADNPAAAETGVYPVHQQQQQQQRQQRQRQQRQRQQRQPCCGPGRGFGTPAARFFGGGVGSSGSSRDGVVACYYGHRNAATVKGVSYFGESDEYVVSGSDCRHVFVWSKVGGEVVWWAAADEEVVNCLEPHPLLPHVLATSGIEHDIKIWAPTAQQPQPPNPTSIRAAMASNRRGRDTSREVMSEPEQWLLQLLAAQRRRSRATERLRRAEAAAAAGGGGSGRQAAATQQQQHTQPRAAAAGNNPDQDMFAEEDDDDDNDADADAEEELEELAANPFARLLARPGALRLRFAGDDDDDDEDDAAAPAAGVGIGGRQRRRRVAGAAAAAAAGDGAGDGEGGVSSSEEGEGQESDGGGGDEGDDERPCYVS